MSPASLQADRDRIRRGERRHNERAKAARTAILFGFILAQSLVVIAVSQTHPAWPLW